MGSLILLCLLLSAATETKRRKCYFWEKKGKEGVHRIVGGQRDELARYQRQKKW
jgi:hypothetical protein